MTRVYLGLGTNLGEREQNLAIALARLQERLSLVVVSSLYETAPWGVTDQPPFLNVAVAAETDLSPGDLLAFVKDIEQEVGRQPSGRWGPRLIDIDILLYADLVQESPDLVIPHPRLAERAFVLVPLAEIAPDVVHPVYQQTIQALLARVSGREGVRLWPTPPQSPGLRDSLDYRQALAYLYSFTDFEKQPSLAYAPVHFRLDLIAGLLAALGDPQRRFRSVHIAGTKGKGSTAAMIASILQAAGYCTGLYTSPHLYTFRERIRINGELISEEALAAAVARLQPFVAKLPEAPSTFEVATALAFDYFAAQGVAVAVLEVGLGGRLDATNVVTPLVSVITSISYDHTGILGKTLGAIAGEKAGIIKEGVPVVSAPQRPVALAVIRRVCRERHAPLCLLGRDWRWGRSAGDLNGQSFWAQGALPSRCCDDLWIPLLGAHELTNATIAVAVTTLLAEQGLAIPEAAIREGLRLVHWPGRLEILSREPLIIADGAHNADSAARLREALAELFPGRRLVLVFGASADKDVGGMARELAPATAAVVLTRSRHPRAADPAALRPAFVRRRLPVYVAADTAAALDTARRLAAPDDLIVVTGSLFVVAEAIEAMQEITSD